MNVWVFARLLLFTALIVDIQATSGECPSGYTDTGGNKCYKVIHSPSFHWSGALITCRMEPGIMPDLATINNQAEQDVIDSFDTFEKWIGLSRQDYWSPFVWSDGSDVSYTNWEAGDRPPYDDCVISNYYGDIGWKNQLCDLTHGYICQTLKAYPNETTSTTSTPTITTPMSPSTTASPGECPSGYTDTGGNKCYKVINTPELHWSDALITCRMEPGIMPDLATINNQAEQDVIDSFGIDARWIGLSRQDEYSPFVWFDGSNVSYTNWVPGDRFVDYHCVINNGYSHGEYGWNNAYCKSTFGYICQTLKVYQNATTVSLPTTTTPMSTTTATTKPGECPSGYTDTGGNKCYKVIESPTLKQPNALAACRMEPGIMPDLAAINSQAEQDVIESFGVQYMFIGLARKDEDSPFLWSDGSNVSYTYWRDSESNLDHCVVNTYYGGDGWIVYNCVASLGYICQTHKAYPDATTTSAPTTTLSMSPSTTTTVSTTTSTATPTSTTKPPMPPSTTTPVSTTTSTMPLSTTSWITTTSGLTNGQVAVLVIGVLVAVWLTSLAIVLVCRHYDNVALKQRLHQLKHLFAPRDKLAQQQQWQDIKA